MSPRTTVPIVSYRQGDPRGHQTGAVLLAWRWGSQTGSWAAGGKLCLGPGCCGGRRVPASPCGSACISLWPPSPLVMLLRPPSRTLPAPRLRLLLGRPSETHPALGFNSKFPGRGLRPSLWVGVPAASCCCGQRDGPPSIEVAARAPVCGLLGRFRKKVFVDQEMSASTRSRSSCLGLRPL